MCSYGYDSQKQILSDPGVAIAADKNSTGNTNRNSTNHDNTGQNVLYYDGHVEWQPTRNAGLGGDNIWHRETVGVLGVSDSYIVQN